MPEEDEKSRVQRAEFVKQAATIVVLRKLEEERGISRFDHSWKFIPDGCDHSQLLTFIELERVRARGYPYNVCSFEHGLEADSFLTHITRGIVPTLLGALTNPTKRFDIPR